MASALRPSLSKQLRLHTSACQALTKQAAGKPTTPSKFNPLSLKTQPIITAAPLLRLAIRQESSFQLSKTAAFHTSGRRAILPAGPQVIDGTANDAARIPEPSPTHGSYHWAFERIMSVALVPLTIAPFAAGTLNPIMDAILCATILIHTHIGFQSVIIDYIPNWRLPRTRAAFWWALRAATLTVAVGFYEFETNDVGLTEGIKRIWTV